MTLPPAETDLRAVYHVPDVDPEELQRLTTVRAERPSLRQIARATREYQDGSPHGLWQILQHHAKPEPPEQLTGPEYTRFYGTGELPERWVQWEAQHPRTGVRSPA